jgi:hypothetical protein
MSKQYKMRAGHKCSRGRVLEALRQRPDFTVDKIRKLYVVITSPDREKRSDVRLQYHGVPDRLSRGGCHKKHVRCHGRLRYREY